MSFLAIVAVVAFILGMLNRASRKSPYVYRDNDNAHLFSNSDGFVQDKSINKKDLTDEIKRYYQVKDYKGTKIKILNYLKYYNEDSFINLMLVISLVELDELSEAEKYANNVLHMLDNNKTGYYLLGYVEYAKGNKLKSLDYMESSLRHGLQPYVIEETINDELYLSKLFKKRKAYDEDDDLPF